MEKPGGLPNPPTILVLGVGNLLLRDEGFGVHAVQRFEQIYAVSADVGVLDGGTAGVGLLAAILDAKHIIVADVGRMGTAPGTVARLDGHDLVSAFKTKQSAHDWGLGEILLQARMLGHEPTLVVLAVEPEDMSSFDLDLSPCLSAALPAFVTRLADEVVAAGGRARARNDAPRKERLASRNARTPKRTAGRAVLCFGHPSGCLTRPGAQVGASLRIDSAWPLPFPSRFLWTTLRCQG